MRLRRRDQTAAALLFRQNLVREVQISRGGRVDVPAFDFQRTFHPAARLGEARPRGHKTIQIPDFLIDDRDKTRVFESYQNQTISHLKLQIQTVMGVDPHQQHLTTFNLIASCGLGIALTPGGLSRIIK